MLVQAGAIYREKCTGRLMVLTGVNSRANNITLAPAGVHWSGTSQEFEASFTLTEEYRPANAGLSHGDESATPQAR